MLQVVLPFVLVTCVLRAVQVVTRVPLRALMLLVLLMTDFMGLVSTNLLSKQKILFGTCGILPVHSRLLACVGLAPQ